jgi:PPOX class probable F420-dependent enzyme
LLSCSLPVRRDAGWARERFAEARVARLATVRSDGRPRLVPVVFALNGDRIAICVDRKPKSTTELGRLADVAVHPDVSLLVDQYSDDWSQLWWARADGHAHVEDVTDELLDPLIERYPQYRVDRPPGPVLVIAVERWSGWSFA